MAKVSTVHRGGMVWLHSLPLTPYGGEWSALCLGCFTPWERDQSTHYTEAWVGPKAGLDIVQKRKIPWPYWESNPDSFIFQPTS
jgi:hypothetical protein